MSLESMIARPGTRCDFVYPREEIKEGGQIEKTWPALYESVPCLLVPVKTKGAETLAYDREKVFVEYKLYIAYLVGISTRMRATMNGRTFEIKKVDNHDEIGLYLRILVKEITVD